MLKEIFAQIYEKNRGLLANESRETKLKSKEKNWNTKQKRKKEKLLC